MDIKNYHIDNIINQYGGLNYIIKDHGWKNYVKETIKENNIIFDKSNEFIIEAIDYILDQWKNKKDISKIKEKIFNDFKLFNFENSDVGKRFVTLDPNSLQFLIFFDDYILTYIFINRKDSIILRISNDFTYGIDNLQSYYLKNNSTKAFDPEDIKNYEDYYLYLYKILLKTNNSFGLKEIIDWNNLNKFNSDNNKGLGLFNFLLSVYQYQSLYKEKASFTTGMMSSTIFPLKKISILGKARFWYKEQQIKAKKITKKLISNLLFLMPKTGFITGGYKGFKSKMYGITRSGYEIAKEYEKPILTIMCKEGLDDYHLFADATYVFGEHWGEDTIALSSLTDGAIFIAPVGGWSFLEMMNIIYHDKPVAILNDCFQVTDNNFTLYNNSEMKQIIDFKLNLLELFNSSGIKKADTYIQKYKCWINQNSKGFFDKNLERFTPEVKKVFQKIEIVYDSNCYKSKTSGDIETFELINKNELLIDINNFIDSNINHLNLKVYSFPKGTRGIWKSLTKINGKYDYIPVFEEYSFISAYFYNQFKSNTKNIESKGQFNAIKNFFLENNAFNILKEDIKLNIGLDGYLNELGELVENENSPDPLIFKK